MDWQAARVDARSSAARWIEPMAESFPKRSPDESPTGAFPGRSRHERSGDFLALLGLAFLAPPALAAFGVTGPASFARNAFGAFGESGILLLAFAACFLLAALFGTVKKAIPVLSGLAAGLFLFAGAFELPGLEGVRRALFRFAPFAETGAALFAGALAVVSGNLAGRVARLKAGPGLVLPPALGLAALLVLAGLDPFPEGATRLDASSVEAALRSVAASFGAEYRNPEVEAAVRRALEGKDATLAEKEKALAELSERLERAEADKAALERAAEGGAALEAELAAARKSLAELEGRLERDLPPVTGGRYDKAVQPADPAVRDFAVKAASAAPGAWDEPQGSRLPNAAGARQLVLVHAALASAWKYVSDPAVSWTDYTSPARRSLALGLAGDCDDFAALVASCVVAVGGRARIVHGIKGSSGHAWAEAWVGKGATAEAVLDAIARAAGRRAASLATTLDRSTGERWLSLDWELGAYSFKGDRLEVAWESGR